MRKLELIINLVLFQPIFIAIGFVLMTLWPANVVAMLALYVVGLIDLVYAKVPLFRHRIFNSFGPNLLPPQRREAYFRGYKRIAFGMAVNVLMLLHYSLMGAMR